MGGGREGGRTGPGRGGVAHFSPGAHLTPVDAGLVKGIGRQGSRCEQLPAGLGPTKEQTPERGRQVGVGSVVSLRIRLLPPEPRIRQAHHGPGIPEWLLSPTEPRHSGQLGMSTPCGPRVCERRHWGQNCTNGALALAEELGTAPPACRKSTCSRATGRVSSLLNVCPSPGILCVARRGRCHGGPRGSEDTARPPAAPVHVTPAASAAGLTCQFVQWLSRC